MNWKKTLSRVLKDRMQKQERFVEASDIEETKQDRMKLLRLIKERNKHLHPIEVAEIFTRYFRLYGTYELPNTNPKRRTNKMKQEEQKKKKRELRERIDLLGVSRYDVAVRTKYAVGSLDNALAPSGTLTDNTYEAFSQALDEIEDEEEEQVQLDTVSVDDLDEEEKEEETETSKTPADLAMERFKRLSNEEKQELLNLLAKTSEEKEDPRLETKDEFDRMSEETELIYDLIVVKAPEHMRPGQVIEEMVNLTTRYKCDIVIETFAYRFKITRKRD